MNTVAYVMILTSFLLVRGLTKGRQITDLFDDLADFYTGMIVLDNAKMREVLARTSTVSDGHIKVEGASASAASGPVDNSRNGRLNANELQALTFARGHRLVPAAANAAERMNTAYKAAGYGNIAVTDSYRDYAGQVAVRASKGNFAAKPGTSKHGLGRALDLGGGVNNWGTPQRQWMVANAPAFGWRSPDWAQQGHATPEPWHWEFS
jgi:hypothetical protein